jgi:signal transduction histidine kinase
MACVGSVADVKGIPGKSYLHRDTLARWRPLASISPLFSDAWTSRRSGTRLAVPVTTEKIASVGLEPVYTRTATLRSFEVSASRVRSRAEGCEPTSGVSASTALGRALASPMRLGRVAASATPPTGARSRDLRQSIDIDHDMRRIETLGFAGKFGSALAHEISTPLNVIAGRIALALRKLPPTSAAQDDLNVMLAQTERVAQILRTVLEPLRPPPLALSRVDARQLVTRTLRPLERLAQALGVELAVRVAPDLPRIQVDIDQLARVIASILLNALETTPSGGRVMLAARRGLSGDRPMVCLSITDGGPGLTPMLLAHVFDPLFLTQTPTNGVSLVLAAARDILRGHDGELRVDSAAGVGTTVTLELPAFEEA